MRVILYLSVLDAFPPSESDDDEDAFFRSRPI